MKKLISLLIVAAMLLGMCAFAAAEEPVEVRVSVSSLGNGWPATLEEDWVYQKILKDINVSFKLELVDDYWNAMGTRMDIYDAYMIDIDHLRTWGRDGALLDLTELKETKLASYYDWLGSTKLLYDGSKSQLCVTIRQDWLDALGLKMPETIQDLYDVAYAFTYNDPDKNGENDTLGLTAAKPSATGVFLFDTILGSFDTAMGNWILIRDGKVTNALLQPGMVQGLEWCKKFVDAKIVDNDCLSTAGTSQFVSGKVGMIGCTWPGIWKAYGQQQIHDVNPNAVTNFFTTLKSEVGAEPAMYQGDLNSTNAILAISADITDEKLDALIKYIDYITVGEGANLVYYGLEGEHWVYDEQGRIRMTENATAANYISTYQLFSRKELEYLDAKFPEAKMVFDQTTAANRIWTYNSLVVEPEGMYLSDMESYARQQLLDFIYGDRELSEAEYANFIQELNDMYQFDEYMAAAEEQLREQGIVE